MSRRWVGVFLPALLAPVVHAKHPAPFKGDLTASDPGLTGNAVVTGRATLMGRFEGSATASRKPGSRLRFRADGEFSIVVPLV